MENSTIIGRSDFQLHNIVCTIDKKLSLSLLDTSGSLSQNSVTIFYEEIPSTTNQELNMILSPFDGDFVENEGYFIEIIKQNNRMQWVCYY